MDELKLPNLEELKEIQLGSLKAWTISEGEGESPEKGSAVTVNYSGWLTSGELFDSSYSRGDAFSFELGHGVIEGWSEAVSQMKSGQKVVVEIPADKAYGNQAVGPIPAGSTLMFLIELVDFF